MTVFAVDSSCGSASAAIVSEGKLLAESYCDIGLRHSETLLPLCDEVFARAGLRPDAVDCFAATAGPGSFTGLRIGIGTVKGMAFGVSRPCAALSTLECLAHNCLGGQPVLAAIDARRGRVFAALFSGDGQRLSEDEVIELDRLAEHFGGLAEGLALVGDAAGLCYNSLCRRVSCFLAPADRLMPRAAAAALLGAREFEAGRAVSAAELKPYYLQLSQAERLLGENKK